MNTFLLIYTGVLVSDKSISGNSSFSLQFNVNSLVAVVIYILLSITSSIFTFVFGSFLIISYIYRPDTTIFPHFSIFGPCAGVTAWVTPYDNE